MGKEAEARWMRHIRRILHPAAVLEIGIVVLSETSWMAHAVMKEGPDRRFRWQGTRLIDEATVGDARVA